MGKIVVTEFVSLDGVIEAPGGGEAFKHAGWTFAINRGPEGDQFKVEETRASEALLLGRLTYEGFAAAWPSREGEFADKFNSMPKYVVSSTLKSPTWANSTVLRGDVVREVSRLKAERRGDIVVHGSAQLGDLGRPVPVHQGRGGRRRGTGVSGVGADRPRRRRAVALRPPPRRAPRLGWARLGDRRLCRVRNRRAVRAHRHRRAIHLLVPDGDSHRHDAAARRAAVAAPVPRGPAERTGDGRVGDRSRWGRGSARHRRRRPPERAAGGGPGAGGNARVRDGADHRRSPSGRSRPAGPGRRESPARYRG